MTETIGKREDDAAFEEWLVSFFISHTQFPDDLPDKERESWLMRYAFDAGAAWEREQASKYVDEALQIQEESEDAGGRAK